LKLSYANQAKSLTPRAAAELIDEAIEQFVDLDTSTS